MSKPRQLLQQSSSQPARRRALHPRPEPLESRLLLYSALGDQWTYGSRITYSLMPDGTSIGDMTSVLFQTLNKNYGPASASWQQQIEAAASLWENAANINLALVPDDGAPEGTPGDQQDDPRFGDIRIGAFPMPSGTLAITFLPPPANGGTDAGDIFLNSNINWQINSNYDLMTVMAHEFGHALGLGDSTVTSAVMYGTYTGIKQSLAGDDVAGIQSVYAAPQFDQFNVNGRRNNMYLTATNITALTNSNEQIAIGGLDITTPGDTEWFYVTAPSSTMTVTVQSSNLSSLSPKFQIYSSSLSLLGQTGAPGSLGATISLTTGVQSGQGYYIKVLAAGGAGPIGSYGLLVNFGTQPQAPIPPPNTLVLAQPNAGAGIMYDAVITPSASAVGSSVTNLPAPVFTVLGNLTVWSESYTVAPSAVGAPAAPANPTTNPTTSAMSPGQQTGLVVSTFTGTTAIAPAASPTPKSVPSPLKVVHGRHHRHAAGDRVKSFDEHIKLKHHH
jgi:hypothetical protein